MPKTTIQQGNVTVTIGSELEKFLDSIEDSAFKAARTALKTQVSGIRDEAVSQWYKQVHERTGKTGDLQVVERISDTVLSFSIQPKDLSDKIKGKWRGFYVHRPGALSLTASPVTKEEYSKLMSEFRTTGTLPQGYKATSVDASGRPEKIVKLTLNDKASDGKYLSSELITKPSNKLKSQLIKDLGPQIAKLAGR